MISCLSLSASASEVDPNNAGVATSTDLTGYTVTVPAGWSATAGYGEFDIAGEYYDGSYSGLFSGLYIGYTFIATGDGQYESLANSICYQNIRYNADWDLSFSVTEGLDASNPSLIQWLVDNNATFTLTNPDSAFPVLPGTYTFTRDSLIASVSTDIGLEVSGEGVKFETEYFSGYVSVVSFYIYAGDPASVSINGIFVNSVQPGKWYNVAGDEVMGTISGTKLIFDETVYSQALLDFLMLNTDYEEINTPEDPVEYITLPAGVYIFDPVLQVPSNVGVYPIEFRSDGTVFYGMSLNTSSLSYGNSSLDAFAPVYDYSGTGWIITDYRWIMLETAQRVDKRLGDYILAETEYLSLEDYFHIYNQGYDSGYDQGYLEGKNLADSDSFIDGFFGDFFGGVRDALDSLVLYESTNTPIPIVVSVWDVISTLVMLFIILFVLKLIAGG